MGALRLTALWVDPLGQRNDRPWPIVGILGPPTTSDAFTLDFSAPPPAEMIRHISSANDPSVTVAAFAFAELVAFDDLDRDGTFHVGQVATGSRMIAPDVYRGAALVHALFYVEQPHAPTVIPELDPILGSSVGYHLAIASCDATTTNGRFVLAQDAAVIKIKLGSAQPTLPQNRGCLQSHVASLAP
ncbi:MAG: hypothetical protein ABJA82_01825 [Myxococcales bacterium]